MVSGGLTCEREGQDRLGRTKQNKITMNLPLLLSLLTTLILSSQAAEDSPVDETLEDNFILDGDHDGDEDEFSGSGDDFCSESSGGSGEEEEESQAYSVQSAIYAMTTGGEVGLDIEITLQRMSDSSVEMLCKMKESEALVEGSGEVLDSLDNFPATIYLIRDLAVCADLGTAVGNDITTSALKLVDVSGPGEDVETLGVSWTEVSQTSCMAILRAGPDTEDVSTEDAVVVESRLAGLARPRCERRKKNILQVPAPTRVFASLNLASFALVSVGVTGETRQTRVNIQPLYLSLSLLPGAFTVAAAAPAVQNFINNNNNNNNNNGAELAVSNFLITISPIALLVGYYYLSTRGAFLRRKFDNFSRSKTRPDYHLTNTSHLRTLQHQPEGYCGEDRLLPGESLHLGGEC